MGGVIQDRRGPSGRHNLVTEPREGRPSTFEVCKSMPELTLESIGFVEVSFSRAAAGLAGGWRQCRQHRKQASDRGTVCANNIWETKGSRGYTRQFQVGSSLIAGASVKQLQQVVWS